MCYQEALMIRIDQFGNLRAPARSGKRYIKQSEATASRHPRLPQPQ